MTSITSTDLLALTTSALAPAGAEPAALVGRALIEAELRGQHRFGLAMLATLPTTSRVALADYLGAGLVDPEQPGPAVELTDRFAPTAVAALLGPARQLAARHGVALIRLLNPGMFGRLAPFVRAIADRGAIGLLTMSSRSFVAPTGADRPLLGTNPFALAVPTAGEPLVVDTASSTITAAHWHDARAGLAGVPDGALIDSTGQPTTDPHAAVAITPRGGQFGSSVAIAIEALTAATTGLLGDPDGAPRGGVLLVIEPAAGAPQVGQTLVDRLTAAGARVPGRSPAWPDRLTVDAGTLARLEQLSALS